MFPRIVLLDFQLPTEFVIPIFVIIIIVSQIRR